MYDFLIVKPRRVSASATAIRSYLINEGYSVAYTYKNANGVWIGSPRFKDNLGRYNTTGIVVNWGNSSFDVNSVREEALVLNHPSNIALAANKLHAFRKLIDSAVNPYVPRFYSSWESIPDSLSEYVARAILTGSGGAGITVGKKRDLPRDCPLYTQYYKKREEFRVHVSKGEVIAVQRKAIRRDAITDDTNWKVRNHANGFIFARNDGFFIDHANLYERLVNLASDSVKALGLDFGAVDIIWNERESCFWILEVNTAPGVEGATINDYGNMLIRVLSNLRNMDNMVGFDDNF